MSRRGTGRCTLPGGPCRACSRYKLDAVILPPGHPPVCPPRYYRCLVAIETRFPIGKEKGQAQARGAGTMGGWALLVSQLASVCPECAQHRPCQLPRVPGVTPAEPCIHPTPTYHHFIVFLATGGLWLVRRVPACPEGDPEQHSFRKGGRHLQPSVAVQPAGTGLGPRLGRGPHAGLQALPGAWLWWHVLHSGSRP